MNKGKICVSKRQLFVVFLVFITGCFVAFINYLNQTKLSTQSRASNIEFDKIIATPGPSYTYLMDCHDAVNSSSCAIHCGADYGVEYGCGGSGRTMCCKMPECTTTVGPGGGVETVKKALLGAYFPNRIPTSITLLNRNGDAKTPLDSGNYRAGDVVSLLPKDHSNIQCKGKYLGNIYQQYFNDKIREPYKGYHVSHLYLFDKPFIMGSFDNKPLDSIYNHLSTLCDLTWKYAGFGFNGRIEEGCNFTTVVKTGALGGFHKCEVFSSVPNAFNWINGGFVSDEYASPHKISSPLSDIKTLAIAVLPKTDPAPSYEQIIKDLCPNP